MSPATVTDPGTDPRRSKHADVPRDYWGLRGPTVRFGRERFRVLWLSQEGGGALDISDYTEQLSWLDDPETLLTGELHVRDPVRRKLRIQHGDELILGYQLVPGSNFIERWRMLVYQPFFSALESSRVLQLETGLGNLARSTDDFNYSVSASRPKGWRAFEAALDIAQRYRIPVGTIAMTTHYIRRLTGLEVSPLDILGRAYTREKNYTHRRFFVSMEHGQLNILPLTRSAVLYSLGPSLIAASLQATLREDFATAVTVRSHTVISYGKDKKGNPRSDVRKLFVELPSGSAQKKYGFVHRDVWAHDSDSVAALTEAAQRHMTLVGKPILESTITHPGLPLVRRGQALRVGIAEPEFDQVVFVTQAQHTISGRDYQMQCQLGFTDPFVDIQPDKVDESRTATARERGRLSKMVPPGSVQPKKHQDLTPGERLQVRGQPRAE